MQRFFFQDIDDLDN